jgi:hypothetical protein
MTAATWPLPADGLVQDSSIACAALDAAISKPNIEVTNHRFFIKYHPFFSIELNPPQAPGHYSGFRMIFDRLRAQAVGEKHRHCSTDWSRFIQRESRKILTLALRARCRTIRPHNNFR